MGAMHFAVNGEVASLSLAQKKRVVKPQGGQVNKTFARVAMAAVAPAILVSAVMLTGGPASAKGKAPAATISCKDLTATITWNPPLVPGASTSKTDQITISDATVSGCTTDPTSTVTAASSVTAKATKSKNGNSCEQFSPSAPPGGKPTTYTFTIGWNGGGGSSKVVFKGSTTTTSPPGFALSAGKGTGSYPTKNTANATADLTPTSATAITTCIGGSGPGVTSVNVSSDISTGAVNL
jgi:hypothetical protein